MEYGGELIILLVGSSGNWARGLRDGPGGFNFSLGLGLGNFRSGWFW